MASGWNLWAWLQCIGVASRCCCKEVQYIDILIAERISARLIIWDLFS